MSGQTPVLQCPEVGLLGVLSGGYPGLFQKPWEPLWGPLRRGTLLICGMLSLHPRDPLPCDGHPLPPGHKCHPACRVGNLQDVSVYLAHVGRGLLSINSYFSSLPCLNTFDFSKNAVKCWDNFLALNL